MADESLPWKDRQERADEAVRRNPDEPIRRVMVHSVTTVVPRVESEPRDSNAFQKAASPPVHWTRAEHSIFFLFQV